MPTWIQSFLSLASGAETLALLHQSAKWPWVIATPIHADMDSEFFKLGKWRGNARLAPSERKMAVGNCIQSEPMPIYHL